MGQYNAAQSNITQHIAALRGAKGVQKGGGIAQLTRALQDDLLMRYWCSASDTGERCLR